MAEKNYREPCEQWAVRSAPILLSFWFIILNMQTFGEGLDFCFDQSKRGYRLDTEVIERVHAESGLYCIMRCAVRLEEPACESANYRKTASSGTQENCELLQTARSEEYPSSLKKDENFDHYVILSRKRGECKGTKLDILFVVDGSASVQKENFRKVKQFIKKLNARFEIGPGKSQIALMQFGTPQKTKIKFGLGEKKTLDEVNQGVEEMEYLKSGTATGDALKKSKTQIFNGTGNDRADASNVLLLFTDGKATDQQSKRYQVEQANELKNNGVKIITVGTGEATTIDKFRTELKQMASERSDNTGPLMFEADFKFLDLIANNLVEEACDTSAAG